MPTLLWIGIVSSILAEIPDVDDALRANLGRDPKIGLDDMAGDEDRFPLISYKRGGLDKSSCIS